MHAPVLTALLALAAAPAGDGPARVDCFGDPLPDGALARVGTVRLRHEGAILGDVALSADHAMLVVADRGAVRVWDAADGKLRRAIDDIGVEELALSPDGKTLAYTNESGCLNLVDLTTGKEIRRLIDGLGPRIHKLAFSPDGKRLASGGHDVVRLWDPAAGEEVRKWEDYKGDVTRLSFSADGARLAFQMDRRGRAVETAAGKLLADFECFDILLAPDGGSAALTAAADRIELRSVPEGKKVREIQDAASFPAAFSPDGKTLIAARPGGGATRLFDAATGAKMADLAGTAAALSADGKVLALRGGQHTIVLCDATTGEELHPRFGHGQAVVRAAFAPDGQTVLTAGRDDRLALWDAATGRLVRGWRADVRRIDPVSLGVAVPYPRFSANGAAVGLVGKPTRRWGAASGKPRDECPGWATEKAGPLAASPDGRLVVLWTSADGVRLWDVEKAAEARPLAGPKPAGVWHAAAFSSDGDLVAALAVETRDAGPTQVNEFTAAVWRVDDGRRVQTCKGQCRDRDLSELLTLCLDGRSLVIGMTKAVRLFDLPDGREREPFVEREEKQTALALSPDGQLFAGADDAGAVWLGEAATGKEVRRWEGHRGPVTSLAFSPDGKALLSTSEDATALLWDVGGRTAKRPPVGSADEREARWAELAGDDAAAAHAAVQALAADPGRAVPLLKDRLKPADGPDAKRLAGLIAALDADDFDERERASQELAKLGRAAAPAARAALAAGGSAEARQRLEALLAKTRTGFTAPETRALRAVEALEWAGTAEARELLEVLARGAEGAVQTQAAASAVRRLKGRPAAP
jgi:WD40 repeat protein